MLPVVSKYSTLLECSMKNSTEVAQGLDLNTPSHTFIQFFDNYKPLFINLSYLLICVY